MILLYCCIILYISGSLALYVPSLSEGKNINFAQSDLDVKSLKQKLLSSFGLTRIPDLSRVNVSPEAMQHAIEIYRRSIQENMDTSNDTEDITEGPGSSFQRFYSYSNTVPKGVTLPLKGHLFFPLDITASADNAKLVLRSAKLRVFKGIGEDDIKVRVENSAQTITIFLYQLMEPVSSDKSDRLLLEIRHSGAQSEEWEEFDVSKCVSTWLEKPLTNFGFQVECQGCKENGIFFVTSEKSSHTGRAEKQATLDILVAETASRSKRSKSLSHKNITTKSPFDCTHGHKSNTCCRQYLQVNFTELGWTWIIQPTTFQAYYCVGSCPRHYRNYGSTHALIQAIFSDKSGGTIPYPCCVPKRMSHLNLLHFNDKDPPELVVTRQERMIVEECACL